MTPTVRVESIPAAVRGDLAPSDPLARKPTLWSRAMTSWREFWFAPAPLLDLGLARIILASIALYLNGSLRLFTVGFPPSELWHPIAIVRMLGVERPSWDQIWWHAEILWVALLASALGLFTRVALPLAFALQLLQEAFLNCFGKVAHGTIPLLYAMLAFALAPCDRAVALDVPLRRWWSRVRGKPAPPVAPLSRFARWPFELVWIELAAYYFLAGVAKLAHGGLAWADGYTLQYYLLEKETPAGLWLASHLSLCQALSALVLVFELGFALSILWRRLRVPLLIGGFAFHLGTIVFLRISFWPVWALYALFLPSIVHSWRCSGSSRSLCSSEKEIS